MRVLMWLRANTRNISGGHQVQLDSTAAALRQRGHEVTVTPTADVKLSEYDVVHALGLDEVQVAGLRAAGVPLAVSTIWWPWWSPAVSPPTLYRRYRQARMAAAKRWWQLTGQQSKIPGAERKALFQQASVLLPNSPSEGAMIRQDLGVSTPMQTVPNGVDTTVFHPDQRPREGFVLMVGRIEPHKNQLATIRALASTDWPVVIAGADHPHHEEYAAACRRALTSKDEIIGPQSPEKLADLYRRAGAHVLNSWFETTGLVTLEAAACDCPVVSTDRGFARDYLGELGFYSDPRRPGSVAGAVAEAMAADGRKLGEKVRSCFTWEQAALRTETAYEVATGQSLPDVLTEALPD